MTMIIALQYVQVFLIGVYFGCKAAEFFARRQAEEDRKRTLLQDAQALARLREAYRKAFPAPGGYRHGDSEYPPVQSGTQPKQTPPEAGK